MERSLLSNYIHVKLGVEKLSRLIPKDFSCFPLNIVGNIAANMR